MKHNGSSAYFQIPRSHFLNNGTSASINNLSLSAFKLYIWLKELEHRYTGTREDFFFRSDGDLASDTKMSRRAISSAKTELKRMGLAEIWQMHWIDQETRKYSEKHVSAYRMR